MTDKPPKILSLVENKPCSHVIGMLEDILQKAKTGEIVSFACAMIVDNGNATTNAFTPNYSTQLIGELRILERDLIDERIVLRLHQAGDAY